MQFKWIIVKVSNEVERRRNMAITLRAARVNKNLTQKQAAKMLEIGANSLVRYETGRSYPNVGVLKKMEQLYEIPYSELIFLEN